MAEPGAPLTAGGGRAGFDFRRILLVAGIVVIILVTLGVLFIRGCASSSRSVKGYSVIYSNLNLKDAANAIARLKELAIPYEIRDEGQAIAVPKDKADQARLGLAEKNLPAGGVVGWEIFDESKLGATDFDRRIQLIRAISGELSRTIQRIQAVEDARVQIVLPETRLFAETVAPVTASVMLRLRPGGELTAAKINGIVHLVASSVENLQTENVTVIDNTGRILTANLA
ncbi:MAG: flagellar basal-body MS-ring/collar protein FliF, partial [bacterium]